VVLSKLVIGSRLEGCVSIYGKKGGDTWAVAGSKVPCFRGLRVQGEAHTESFPITCASSALPEILPHGDRKLPMMPKLLHPFNLAPVHTIQTTRSARQA